MYEQEREIRDLLIDLWQMEKIDLRTEEQKTAGFYLEGDNCGGWAECINDEERIQEAAKAAFSPEYLAIIARVRGER